jgi:SAM-dependent methyltransferase
MPQSRSTDDRLYCDPELVQFYDIENEGGEDQAFCLRLAKDRQSVLDLGCGTGQLAAALANGRFVTGVDPAAAMLKIARHRPNGKMVNWVEADARDIRLGQKFDLVLLTGHAFQVFVTEPGQKAVLRTIAHHLEPGGCFIFDSRNPGMEEWRNWNPQQSERILEHPLLGAVKAWNDTARDAVTGIVTYETNYEILTSGRRLSAKSDISFPTREALAEMLDGAGLFVEEWLGDWLGGTFCQTSPEIIPIGHLR